MICIGTLTAGFLWLRRNTLLTPVGHWLQTHHITLAHSGLVTIPHLGGLDTPRLLLAAAVVTAVTAAAVAGKRRTHKDDAGTDD